MSISSDCFRIERERERVSECFKTWRMTGGDENNRLLLHVCICSTTPPQFNFFFKSSKAGLNPVFFKIGYLT